MNSSGNLWDSNEKQLRISGFQKFKQKSLEGIFKGDIWNRDVVVAESGLECIKDQVKQNKPLTIFVGYSPGKPHLGYLVMNRFLKSFREYSGTNILLGINIRESMETHNRTLEDTLNVNDLVERALLGKEDTRAHRIYDLPFLNEQSIQRDYDEVYSQVIRNLTFADFNKIMGWDERTSLSQFEGVSKAISGMLYANVKSQNSLSVIFTDLKHLPFVRLAKKASRKMGIREPSFLVTTYLPSLTDEDKRMSSTGGGSTIYLFSDDNELNKYLKIRSGGRSKEEQKVYGGKPDSCLALKITTYIIYSKETERIISECTSGRRESCKECKRIMASYINKEIESL